VDLVGRSRRFGVARGVHLEGGRQGRVSALVKDTASFSETSASTNQSTRRLNPEDLHQIAAAVQTVNLTVSH
jgi:hypothetical protein